MFCSKALLLAASWLSLWPSAQAHGGHHRKTCTVRPGRSVQVDDAPAIVDAFKKCGHHGKVVFLPTTYHVNTVMNITWLNDVEVDIWGNLLWSTDIDYWLSHSLPVGFQNQSTAFILGGNNVHIDGHGVGAFLGNGDVWYEFIASLPENQRSNYHGRPHALTTNGLLHSSIKNLKFIRSQMWTLSMIYSHHVDLDNIFVNNTGNKVSSFNNDGADTIRSSHINFRNWTVYNGDDCLSLKGNSTDIGIYDSKCYDGSGIALGSVGQFQGVYETMERLTVKNVHFGNTLHAVYFKSFTGTVIDYPPNGGGGGLGFGSDMKFHNLTVDFIRNAAVAISQCTQFTGSNDVGNCTNSPYQFRNLVFDGIKGTTLSDRAASFQCSVVSPCTNIAMHDIQLELANNTTADQYLCGNVRDPRGFNCTGVPCEKPSPSGEC